MADDETGFIPVPTVVAEQLAAIVDIVRRRAGDRAGDMQLAEACKSLDFIAAELHTARANQRAHETQRNGASREAFAHPAAVVEAFEFPLDAFVLTDRYGVIQEANNAAAYLLQTRREFLIGKPLAFYFPERERAAFYSHLLRKDLDRPLQRWQTVLYTPKGQTWHVEVAMSPALDGQNGDLELRWLLRNISPVKLAETALLEMKS